MTRIRLALSLAVLAALTAVVPAAAATPEPHRAVGPADATSVAQSTRDRDRELGELERWARWLERADAEGFVGEVGWPDEPRWNRLANSWLRTAGDSGIETTAWAAGSWWGPYPLLVYGSRANRDRRLTRALPQAELVERHDVGVNVAGLEFGTHAAFSADRPGRRGRDWFVESAESFEFLADRGIDLVRVPIRWERLQRELDGPLDASYASAIEEVLDACAANGIGAVLDVHNYGRYVVHRDRTLALGTDRLGGAQLADLWRRIVARFGDHPGIAAWGLMNEPHDLRGRTTAIAADRWEQISQRVLDAIRREGDTTTVIVPGYDWSSLERWRTNHPEPWIDDPADAFRYEAHHYWDPDGSGTYRD